MIAVAEVSDVAADFFIVSTDTSMCLFISQFLIEELLTIGNEGAQLVFQFVQFDGSLVQLSQQSVFIAFEVTNLQISLPQVVFESIKLVFELFNGPRC